MYLYAACIFFLFLNHRYSGIWSANLGATNEFGVGSELSAILKQYNFF